MNSRDVITLVMKKLPFHDAYQFALCSHKHMDVFNSAAHLAFQLRNEFGLGSGGQERQRRGKGARKKKVPLPVLNALELKADLESLVRERTVTFQNLLQLFRTIGSDPRLLGELIDSIHPTMRDAKAPVALVTYRIPSSRAIRVIQAPAMVLKPPFISVVGYRLKILPGKISSARPSRGSRQRYGTTFYWDESAPNRPYRLAPSQMEQLSEYVCARCSCILWNRSICDTCLCLF